MKVEVVITKKYVIDVDELNGKYSRSILRYAPFAESLEDKANIVEAVDNVRKYEIKAIVDTEESCGARFVDEEANERENMG